MTAPTAATTTAAHPFRPDFLGEPGYRVRCTVCGRERAGHPYSIPAPRKATR